MNMIKNMPASGVIVISIIAILFVLAVILLFYVRLRYRLLEGKASGTSQENRGFRSALLSEYTAAYKQFGQNVNTPAIITDVVSARLGGLLLCERFLNNAVSLFVTLGLFGTFLGLSMSVTSLTELIGYSNTSEWLSVLDSVGEGLMSALSGMGVAFYTSLAGAGASILLTILRTILSPQAARERLETRRRRPRAQNGRRPEQHDRGAPRGALRRGRDLRGQHPEFFGRVCPRHPGAEGAPAAL